MFWSKKVSFPKNNSFECSHDSFTDVKDGYQYCKKCNKAFLAPKKECDHHWFLLSEIIVKGAVKGYLYECLHCGSNRKEYAEYSVKD